MIGALIRVTTCTSRSLQIRATSHHLPRQHTVRVGVCRFRQQVIIFLVSIRGSQNDGHAIVISMTWNVTNSDSGAFRYLLKDNWMKKEGGDDGGELSRLGLLDNRGTDSVEVVGCPRRRRAACRRRRMARVSSLFRAVAIIALPHVDCSLGWSTAMERHTTRLHIPVIWRAS